MHLLALGELGKKAPDLANLADVYPRGGRQYELWQPILALAGWVDFCRKEPTGRPPLHPRLLAYAKRVCENGSESAVPEEDYLLLRALTERAVRDDLPTCKAILESARRTDADAMRGVTARRVAEVLKRYGLQTKRLGGKRIFRGSLDQLRRIETRYGVDLNTAGKDSVSVVKVRAY